MVHYRIENTEKFKIFDNPAYGVVEHCFENISYEELATIVNLQIETTTSILEDWMNINKNQQLNNA